MGSDLLWTHLFDDDCLLSVVAAPPDVGVFDVGVWEASSDFMGLTCTCLSVVPLVLELCEALWVGAEEFVALDTVLELLHLLNLDEALVHGFSGPELTDELVPLGDLALLVVPGWLDAEGPWAFQAGVFFVAVVIGSVVDFDYLEVCLLAVLLQSWDALVLSKVQEELDVRGTFGPLL